MLAGMCDVAQSVSAVEPVAVSAAVIARQPAGRPLAPQPGRTVLRATSRSGHPRDESQRPRLARTSCVKALRFLQVHATSVALPTRAAVYAAM